MIALMLGALRARRAQTWCVLVLAVLAVAAAVAAPWYVLAAMANSGATDARTAPSSQRLVSITQSAALTAADPADGAMRKLRDQVGTALPVRNAPIYLGVLTSERIFTPLGPAQAPIAARDGACDHLTIVGRCPTQQNEVLISSQLSTTLHRGVGQVLPVLVPVPVGQLAPPPQIQIVGVYGYADLTGSYWAGSRFSGLAGGQIADPIFTTAAGVQTIGLADSLVVAEVPLPPAAFADGPALRQTLDAARARLTENNATLQTQADAVLALISNDQQLIRVGVPAALGQLIMLCWFAIFLASRYTAADRRADAALMRLRGLGRGWMIRLIAAEAAGPIVLALIPGALVGWLAARVAAGGPVDSDHVRVAVQLSAAAVAIAVLGALLAAVLGETRNLQASVVDLLRRVPARTTRWRAGVVDLVVVSLALATAYQVHAGSLSSTPGLSVGLLAQGLIELALALIGARLLVFLAVGAGRSALRTGRIRLAMGGLQVARRPGTDRILALVAVATAILCSSWMSWDASVLARTQRATVDTGAARVLSVQAANPTQLLYTVRQVDPSGRSAMAVVLSPDTVSGVATLAVDSARLAAVGLWPAGYTDQLDAMAAALRLSTPALPALHGATAQVQASTAAATGPVPTWLAADLRDGATGELSTAWFGPLGTARATYSATVACTGPAGCELVDFRPVLATPGSAGVPPTIAPPTSDDNDQPLPAGQSVTVFDLRQPAPGGEVLSPATLGDIRRFRGSLDPNAAGLAVSAQADQLVLTGTEAPSGTDLDQHVFVLAAPVPVPVLAAGATRAVLVGESAVRPFNGGQLPTRRVGTVPMLPEVGTDGLLVDLDTVRRSLTDSAGGTQMQVWLAGSAPPDTTARLQAAGLRVTAVTSLDTARLRLDRQGGTAALRFQLLSGAIGVLLAAATLLVAAAAGRQPRAEELSALRAQGMPARLVRGVGLAGYLPIVLAGVLVGAGSALVAGWLVGAASPPFPDGWHDLPQVSDVRLPALGAAALVALVVLAAVAFQSSRALGRLVRRIGGQR